MDAAADHRGHGCRRADRYLADLTASQHRSDRCWRRQLIRDAQSMRANARCDAVPPRIPTRQAPPPVSAAPAATATAASRFRTDPAEPTAASWRWILLSQLLLRDARSMRANTRCDTRDQCALMLMDLSVCIQCTPGLVYLCARWKLELMTRDFSEQT